MTGLPNHAAFTEICEDHFEELKGTDKKSAIILIDIEHFSQMNDRYGHVVGDEILKRVAYRIKATARPYDTIARLGSNEYAILCNGIPQWGLSHCVMELGDQLNKPLTIDENISINIRCKIGVAHAPACGDSFSILYQCAKIALDKSRKNPICHFYFYEQEQDLESKKFQRIVSLFDDALVRKEFSVLYQPQFRISDLEIVGSEALIRWESQEEGIISPAYFIPIAEESRHIVEIGQWVISQVAADMASIDCFRQNKLRVAINLSALQLVKSNLLIFVHQLYQSLLDNNLAEENFDLEITEHAFMEIDESVIQSLSDLKKKNFHISLDDFGTGYSSLSYIQKLPLNNLKIDISFIRMIGEDHSVEEIIKLIINLAHVLGLKTIAEGVETQIQLEFLRKNNCDYGQGYLISKPVSIEKYKALLEHK